MRFVWAFAIVAVLGIIVFLGVGGAGAQVPCVQPISSDTISFYIDNDAVIVSDWFSDCLSEKPAPDGGGGSRYARFYTFTLSAATDVAVTLESEQDTYLYIMDSLGKSGTILHENDDITPGSNTNSRIEANLQPGEYTIEATTYNTATVGVFTLIVKGLPAPAPTVEPVDPTPTQDPVPPNETPEPVPTTEPVPVPTTPPVPPSGSFDDILLEGNCLHEDFQDTATFINMSGPDYWDPNPWGVVASYRTKWEIAWGGWHGDGSGKLDLVCMTVIYDRVDDARWALTYSTQMQYNGRSGRLLEHEQVFLPTIGDDTLAYWNIYGRRLGYESQTPYIEDYLSYTVMFMRGRVVVLIGNGSGLVGIAPPSLHSSYKSSLHRIMPPRAESVARKVDNRLQVQLQQSPLSSMNNATSVGAPAQRNRIEAAESPPTIQLGVQP